MTPERAIEDACRQLCGPELPKAGRHDDACHALRGLLPRADVKEDDK